MAGPWPWLAARWSQITPWDPRRSPIFGGRTLEDYYYLFLLLFLRRNIQRREENRAKSKSQKKEEGRVCSFKHFQQKQTDKQFYTYTHRGHTP
jgi:hypothetical protein